MRPAADELDVSPGNISEQIKSLERGLGVRLFDRGPRRLKLTQAGEAFLDRVEQALSLIKTAREEMLDFAQLERGQLLVGALPGLGPFWLSRFLVDFLNRHPYVDLRLIERGGNVLLKLLATGEVHAACVLLPGDGDQLPPRLSAHCLGAGAAGSHSRSWAPACCPVERVSRRARRRTAHRDVAGGNTTRDRR
jgi:LysR family hydrogen peroxide-inducible transcriptional activator